MSSVVVNGTIDVLQKALKKFAAEDKTFIVKPSEVKIIIAISPITVEEPTAENPIKRIEGEPFYRIVKQDKPYMRSRKIKVHPGAVNTDEVSFLQVLGAKLDFFQLEMQSKPYLMDGFKNMAKEVNADMLNNPGFISYVDDLEQKAKEAGQTQEYIDEIEASVIKEQTIKDTDLELMITCIPKNSPEDEPMELIPFLYSRGQFERQLSLAKDIFNIEE